jgi:hypothetical protein
MKLQKIMLGGLLGASALITACGGGGGGSSSSTPPPVVSSCQGTLPSLVYSTSYSTRTGDVSTFTPSSLSTLPTGCTATVTATGLPAGLSINASTGVISGVPTVAGNSSVVVTLTIRNNANVVVSPTPTSSTIALTVALGFSPTITSANAATLLFNGAYAVKMNEFSRGSYDDYLAFSNPSNWTAFLGAGRTQNCTVSGNWKKIVKDVDTSNTLSVGDTLEYVYTNCSDTAGSSLSGSQVITVEAQSGGSPRSLATAWASRLRTTTNLSYVISGTESRTVETVASYTLTAGTDNILGIRLTYSTFKMNYVNSAAPVNNYSFTDLKGNIGYATEIVGNGVTSVPYAKSGILELSGTDNLVNSGAPFLLGVTFPTPLGGTFNLSTGKHSTPTVGRILVTGAGNRSVSSSASTTPVLSFSTADIDTDGNGGADTTINYSISTTITPN